MTTPFVVDAVGVRTLDGGLEAVGCKVGDRLAGTLVVDAGHGEPLAQLLLSAGVVEAARTIARLYGSQRAAEPDMETFEALMALVRAVAATEAHDPERSDDPDAVLPHTHPGPRGLQHKTRPGEQIIEANNRLYYGNPEGKAGTTIWRATAVAGVVLVAAPGGSVPRPYATFQGDRSALACWRPLTALLREVADGIDAQYVAAALDEARR